MTKKDMPFSERDMAAWGYQAWRCLDDGTVLAVGPMGFGNGRLYWDVHQDGYTDFYCYDGLAAAEQSMLAFDPKAEHEPTGWKRHGSSGRRRPGGDPAQEYVSL